MWRLIVIFLLLSVAVIVPFLIWNESIELLWTGDAGLDRLREHGAFSGLIGMGLLCLDIFLPIPASAVMSAMGILHGPLIGGIYASAGSFFSGMIGYLLTRAMGRKVAIKLCGEKDLYRAEAFFNQWGGIAVAASRWMPVFPEAIACMAGLSQMKFWRFCVALMAGSIPIGFAYAIFGAYNSDHPILVTVIAITIPVILWVPVQVIILSKKPQNKEASSDEATST